MNTIFTYGKLPAISIVLIFLSSNIKVFSQCSTYYGIGVTVLSNGVETSQVCYGASVGIRISNLTDGVMYELSYPGFSNSLEYGGLDDITWSINDLTQSLNYQIKAWEGNCPHQLVSNGTIEVLTSSVAVSIEPSGDPVSACEQSGFYLTAVGDPGLVYTWHANHSIDIEGFDQGNVHGSVFEPDQSATYWVTASRPCNSVATSNTIPVTLIPRVYMPTLSGPLERCQGSGSSSYTSSAQYATGFSWSISGSGNSISSNGLVTWSSGFSGKSLITVTSNGCGGSSKSTSIEVAVKPSPTATFSPSGSLTICSTCTQLITAVEVNGGAYQWIKNGSIIPEATGKTYLVNQSALYTLDVEKDNCITHSYSTFDVHVNLLPEVNAGLDRSISLPAQNSSVILLGAAADPDGSISSYEWTQLNGPLLTLSGISSPQLTISDVVPGSYTFTLKATDDFHESKIDAVSLIVSPPPDNYNYVKEAIISKEGVETIAAVKSASESDKVMTTNYFDGLGRAMQSVSWRQSPLLYDMIVPIIYDKLGRQSITYLPYISEERNGLFKPGAVAEQASFYSEGGSIVSDLKPYSEITFETSPLNRELKRGAPGDVWQPNTDVNSMADNTVKTRYSLNLDNEVFQFHYDLVTGTISESVLTERRYYDKNQLYANKTYDENNNEVIEYVDKEGLTVCKKVYVKTENNLRRYAETYYIYDDFGNLVLVLPPEGVEKIKNDLD